MTEKTTNEVLMNLALHQSMEVSKYLQRSIRMYLSGDIEGSFWSLVAIRRIIIYEFSENTRKELLSLESKVIYFKEKYNSSKKNFNSDWYDENEERDRNRSSAVYQKIFSKTVDEYSTKIMDLLNSLGFFPHKKDRTKIGI